MPSQLVKTLTWDQGSEMAGHAAFSLATAVDVYFAHPHSSWERGTNENTNGLLREYFPKGTEITDDQAYLDLVARELNNRPPGLSSASEPQQKSSPTSWPAQLLPPLETTRACGSSVAEALPCTALGRSSTTPSLIASR